jgi:hypothetical protein
MKNQLLKLRKAEGFVSIETIMVASIMVLAGLVAYNFLFATTLEGKANAAIGDLTTAIPTAGEVIYMVLGD